LTARRDEIRFVCWVEFECFVCLLVASCATVAGAETQQLLATPPPDTMYYHFIFVCIVLDYTPCS